MAATDNGAPRPAQISKKYSAGARAMVIGSEGFDCVADNGFVGPNGNFNGIVGSVAGLELSSTECDGVAADLQDLVDAPRAR